MTRKWVIPLISIVMITLCTLFYGTVYSFAQNSSISTNSKITYPNGNIKVQLEDFELNWIKENSELKVGYLKNYLPYSGVDNDGNVTGIVYDIIQMISEDLSITSYVKFDYICFDNYEAMVEGLKDGTIDVAFPIYSCDWFSDDNNLIESKTIISATSDLVYKGEYYPGVESKIAVDERNLMQYAYTITVFPNADIVFCNSTKECLDSVLNGDANSTIINGLRTNRLLSTRKYNALVGVSLSEGLEFCFAVNSDNDILLSIINKGIDSINSDYVLADSYRYLSQIYDYSFWDFLASHVEVLVLVITAFFLLIIVTIYIYLNGVKKNQKILNDTSITLNNQFLIFEAIGNEYADIAVVGLESQKSKMLKINGKMKNYQEFAKEEGKDYYSVWNNYIDNFVLGVDRANLRETIKLENLLSKLESTNEILLPYRVFVDGKILNYQVKIVKIDSLDVKEEALVIAFVGVDDILDEQRKLEQLEEAANKDRMTGFYNRRAYEVDILSLEKTGEFPKDFVVGSLDLDGLKTINDKFGHEAGDELIIGATTCMTRAINAYGKLYRIGGDEFIAIISANSSELEAIKKDIEGLARNWKGSFARGISISYGFVAKREMPNLSLEEMVQEADHRMYEKKEENYRNRGIDRRGQLGAFEAIQKSYSKIIKVNLTEDTYSIIKAKTEELNEACGLRSTFSDWLIEFAMAGMVHPEDRDLFIKKTNLYYLRNYFEDNNAIFFIHYRRRDGDNYKRVLMEIIVAEEYTKDNQVVYAFVKDVEH